MSLEFTPARLEDVQTLLGLVQAYYAYDHLPYDEAGVRAALEGLITDPERGRVWLIRAEGQAIGYAILTLGYSLEYQGLDAFIDEIFLEASHRGRGLGREVLGFLEVSAKTLGVRALHLEVERANRPAQALYRRNGYCDNDRQLLTKRLVP